jgi:MFS family permease
VVAFRALWAAQMASNMAIWIHTVSLQWVLTSAGNSTTVVAAVQTAITLPFFLLALPAGVLADALERRRVLVTMQLTIAVVSLALALATGAGGDGLAGVLLATLGMGAASAISIVAWQSLVPELVDRPSVPAAATLDGMSFNAGRIVGPAVGGVLLSVVSPPWIFGLNACVFALAGLAFWRWTPARVDRAVREPIVAAISSGLRYVRHSPLTRRLLVRTLLWTLPASLVWALLPLIAHDRLGLDSGGFGALFAALGIGAVTGGVVLQPVRARMTPNAVLVAASLTYAIALLTIAAVPVVPVVALALALAGSAWITVMSMVMALAQSSLPPWVRARGLATVLLVHQGSMAFGSLLWGLIGDAVGIPQTLLIDGGFLILAAASVRWFGLRSTDGVDPAPVSMWTEPSPFAAVEAARGPVLVLIEYEIVPEASEAFLAAIEPLGRLRRRIGARRWEVYTHGSRPNRFIEAYVVPSWGDHVHQESVRWTRRDKRIHDRVVSLAQGPPTVERLFAAGPGRDRETAAAEPAEPAVQSH